MGSQKPISRSLQVMGDSIGVTLPHSILEAHDLDDDDDVAITRYDSDAGELTFSLD